MLNHGENAKVAISIVVLGYQAKSPNKLGNYTYIKRVI